MKAKEHNNTYCKNRLANSEDFSTHANVNTQYHNLPHNISDTYRCESLFPERRKMSRNLGRSRHPYRRETTFAFPEKNLQGFSHHTNGSSTSSSEQSDKQQTSSYLQKLR